jgi:tRNA A37 threonylcarbamoyltransferase TsaD
VRAAIAWQFQETCVRFLTERTRRALARCAADQQQLGMAPLTCLVVAGGVAANKAVRAGLDAVAAEFGLPCVYPPVKYCTDNGLMVAWTGVERLKAGLARPPPAPEEVEGSVEVLPRWPLGPVDVRGMARRTQEHVKLLH